MKTQRVLLLGSSGFIGKHLLVTLSPNYHILAPSHQDLDLLDTEKVQHYFQKQQVDAVINAVSIGASKGGIESVGTLADDLTVYLNIIGSRKHYRRLIQIGSGAEYDKNRPLHKISEADFGRIIPHSDYGLAKYVMSTYGEVINQVVTLRVFGLFGSGEDYRHRFIANAICRNLYGLPIVITQDRRFDYLWVNDFCAIVDFVLRYRMRYRNYNVGSGRPLKLSAIAQMINAIADQKSQIMYKTEGMAHEYSCDNSRLLFEIGDIPLTDFRKALTIVYQWYKVNLHQIDKNDL